MISAVKNLGITKNDPLFAVGVVLDNLRFGHLNLFALKSINDLCQDVHGFDIQLLVSDISTPCITSLAPINNIDTLHRWEHPIISTSTSGLISSLRTRSQLIINYIFNMDFWDRDDISYTDIRDRINDPRVVNVTRNTLYREIVEKEFGCKVMESAVNDFDMRVFASIIIEKHRDSHAKK